MKNLGYLIIILIFWSCKPKQVELPACYSPSVKNSFLDETKYYYKASENQTDTSLFSLAVFKNDIQVDLGLSDSISVFGNYYNYSNNTYRYDSTKIAVFTNELVLTENDIIDYRIENSFKNDQNVELFIYLLNRSKYYNNNSLNIQSSTSYYTNTNNYALNVRQLVNRFKTKNYSQNPFYYYYSEKPSYILVFAITNENNSNEKFKKYIAIRISINSYSRQCYDEIDNSVKNINY